MEKIGISPRIQNFCTVFERNEMKEKETETEREMEGKEIGYSDSENYEILFQSLFHFGLANFHQYLPSSISVCLTARVFSLLGFFLMHFKPCD